MKQDSNKQSVKVNFLKNQSTCTRQLENNKDCTTVGMEVKVVLKNVRITKESGFSICLGKYILDN